MVLMVRRRGKRVSPKQITFPVESLDDAADSAAEKLSGLVVARAHQIPVVHEVSHQAGASFRFPMMNLPSAFVN